MYLYLIYINSFCLKGTFKKASDPQTHYLSKIGPVLAICANFPCKNEKFELEVLVWIF